MTPFLCLFWYWITSIYLLLLISSFSSSILLFTQMVIMILVILPAWVMVVLLNRHKLILTVDYFWCNWSWRVLMMFWKYVLWMWILWLLFLKPSLTSLNIVLILNKSEKHQNHSDSYTMMRTVMIMITMRMITDVLMLVVGKKRLQLVCFTLSFPLLAISSCPPWGHHLTPYWSRSTLMMKTTKTTKTTKTKKMMIAIIQNGQCWCQWYFAKKDWHWIISGNDGTFIAAERRWQWSSWTTAFKPLQAAVTASIQSQGWGVSLQQWFNYVLGALQVDL